MTQKTILWDIDDVLTPTSETFYQAALETHGNCPHPDHWSDYLWGQHIGKDEGLETQHYLIEQKIIEKCKPYDYTRKALELTNRAGFKNILLSARAWHPDPVAVTQQWLIDHDLSSFVNGMYFLPVDTPKSDAIAMLLKSHAIHAFIEDNPKHAAECPPDVPHVYLVRRSWNKLCQDNPRVHCVDSSYHAAAKICLTPEKYKELFND